MAAHFKIPQVNPFWFVQNKLERSIHFGESWFCNQIKSYELKKVYHQKWVKADTTALQIESSIAPTQVKLVNAYGKTVKTFNWTAVFSSANYTVYEMLFDVADVANGVHYLYFEVEFFAIHWNVISEPIAIADRWPETLLFKYRNSFNDFGIAFTTGITFQFRCEATIAGYKPKRDRSTVINQQQDIKTTRSTPYKTFKLFIGGNPGATDIAVAPYIVDILNNLFSCDTVHIEGKRYESLENSEFDVQEYKNYPLITAELPITFSFSNNALEFANTDEIAPGLIVAYNIHTDFFGAGSTIPIIEIEQH